jgi:hypothetical protein
MLGSSKIAPEGLLCVMVPNAPGDLFEIESTFPILSIRVLSFVQRVWLFVAERVSFFAFSSNLAWL